MSNIDSAVDYALAEAARRGDDKSLGDLLRKIIDELSISSRIINLTDSTLTVTQVTHDDKTITVNRAAGSTLTLPAATGSGMRVKIVVGTTITSNNLVVQVTGDDIMMGTAIVGADGGSSVVGWETGATDDTITMNGTTTGGIKGDIIELEDVAADTWSVKVIASATGTEATPFSAAV